MSMRKFQEPTFEEAEVSDILSFTKDFKDRGYTFVNINCTTCDDHIEVLYAFRAPGVPKGITGKTVKVETGGHLPSITEYYPEAFVFENEGHDLFDVVFDGISIDYGGEFYTLAVAYPMNPKAAVQDPKKEDYAKHGGIGAGGEAAK